MGKPCQVRSEPCYYCSSVSIGQKCRNFIELPPVPRREQHRDVPHRGQEESEAEQQPTEQQQQGGQGAEEQQGEL